MMLLLLELWEGIILVVGLLVCGLGQAWLLWDIDKQIHEHEKRIQEQCPALEEDDEREE